MRRVLALLLSATGALSSSACRTPGSQGSAVLAADDGAGLAPVTLAQEPQRVLYEIYVRGFYDGSPTPDGTGDLDGIRLKLGELAELGVDTLLLMPIFDSADQLGYMARSFTDVGPDYGTNASFKALADAAHQQGMKIMLDIPLNHVSYDAPWFLRGSLKTCKPSDPGYKADNPDNEYCNYFYFAADPCHKVEFPGAPFTHWHKPWAWNSTDCNAVFYQKWQMDPTLDRTDRFYATFSSGMPDLAFWDYRTGAWNKPLLDRIQKALNDWALLGVDAFRIDAAKHLVEGEANNANPLEPRNLELLRNLLAGTRLVKPAVSFVGEIWDSHATIEPYVGKALDMVFDFPYMTALRDGIGSHNATPLKNVLKHMADRIADIKPGQRVVFATNHDLSRLMSEWNDDEAKVRAAQFITMMTPFVPQLYYGEELGMHGKVKRPDASSAEEYVRTIAAYPWTGDPKTGGFPGDLAPVAVLPDNAALRNLAAEKADPKSLWTFLKKAIALRKTFGINNDTLLGVHEGLGGSVLGFTLAQPAKDGKPARCRTVFVNFAGQDAQTAELKHAHPACAGLALAEVYADGATRKGASPVYALKPYGKLVLGD